jgi:hypothetical protein
MSMSWSRLLEAERLAQHRISKQELDALRAAIERNLKDAGLDGLSADNRFGLAYEAAPLAAKLAIHAAGYRVKRSPEHTGRRSTRWVWPWGLRTRTASTTSSFAGADETN